MCGQCPSHPRPGDPGRPLHARDREDDQDQASRRGGDLPAIWRQIKNQVAFTQLDAVFIITHPETKNHNERDSFKESLASSLEKKLHIANQARSR